MMFAGKFELADADFDGESTAVFVQARQKSGASENGRRACVEPSLGDVTRVGTRDVNAILKYISSAASQPDTIRPRHGAVCSGGVLSLLMARLAAPSFRGAGMRLGARHGSPCFFQGERRSGQNVPATGIRNSNPDFCAVAGTSADGCRFYHVRLSTALLSPPWPGSWLSGLTLARVLVARIWSGQGWSCQPLRPAIRSRMAGHFVPAVPTGPFPSRHCLG